MKQSNLHWTSLSSNTCQSWGKKVTEISNEGKDTRENKKYIITRVLPDCIASVVSQDCSSRSNNIISQVMRNICSSLKIHSNQNLRSH